MKGCQQNGGSIFLSKVSLSNSAHVDSNGICSPGETRKAKSLYTKLKYDKLYRKKIAHTIILGWAFFFLGWSIGMFGPCFPDLMLILDTDLEKTSWLFTIGAFGYLVGAMLGGVAYDRYNKMLLLFVCMTGMAITNAAIPWCTSFPIMLSMVFLCGMFEGSIETGGNADVVSIWKAECSPFMLAIHFAYSAGGIISPFVTEPFLAKNQHKADLNDSWSDAGKRSQVVSFDGATNLPVIDYRTRASFQSVIAVVTEATHLARHTIVEKYDSRIDARYELQLSKTDWTTVTRTLNEAQNSPIENTTFSHNNENVTAIQKYGETNIHFSFMIAGVMTMLAAIPFLVLFLSSYGVRLKTVKSTNSDIGKGKSKAYEDLSPKLKVACLSLLSFILFLYSAIEDNFFGLLMTFSISHLGWSKAYGSVATSLDWMSFAAGRLVGIFLVRHFETNTILTSHLVGLVISFTGFLISSLTLKTFLIWAFVPLAGFSQSVILPAIFTWTEEKLLPVTGKISGLYLVTGSAGSMVTPLLFGYLMEEYTSVWYVYLLLLMSTVSCVCFFVVRITEHCLVRHVTTSAGTDETVKMHLNGSI